LANRPAVLVVAPRLAPRSSSRIDQIDQLLLLLEFAVRCS
jgi:hypothetical protein